MTIKTEEEIRNMAQSLDMVYNIVVSQKDRKTIDDYRQALDWALGD